jgi:hypothetical protein
MGSTTVGDVGQVNWVWLAASHGIEIDRGNSGALG